MYDLEGGAGKGSISCLLWGPEKSISCILCGGEVNFLSFMEGGGVRGGGLVVALQTNIANFKFPEGERKERGLS